jgi:hypothetical protein
MDVRWSYEGISFRHTEAETPDPECHTWQGPVEADELIIHAANLYLFRTAAPGELTLWSLRRKAGQPLPEDRVRPRVQ